MSTYDPVERAEAALRRSLVTPEGVDLNLRIGDAGQRAGAFIIDWLIQIVTLVLFSWLCLSILGALGMKGLTHVYIVWALGSFFLRNAWFIGFELSPRAATIGKRIMGLRVAARDGGRLTAEAVITRNIMREIEFATPVTLLLIGSFSGGAEGMTALLIAIWTGIFLFFPLFNKDRLRAGDLVAGTWVVRTPKRSLLPDMAAAGTGANSRFAFTSKQLDAYGVKELHVLEQVLRTRDRKTMAAVAQRIRRKIDWQPYPDESDAEFLDAYYTALRARLEQRMLLGHRRKDKFDKA
ncbi:RDD family protein [Caulobacter sp. SLTY]|uniref:RDD family protein n=1 Tax=Caulobacter sp. SLTY TaxID=2683262 RepID=UPI0014130B45|nr:RDD family protein [Caulobacter sp. SLTY]NBB16259.1 RDD family protein [Caulobacter sp. SLTY]